MIKSIQGRGLSLLGLAALALGAVGCGATVGAGPATPPPTADVRPGAKPGDTPAPVPARPTLVPGDPGMPVSNETPVTPNAPRGTVPVRVHVVDAATGKALPRARIVIPKSSVPLPDRAYITNEQGDLTLNLPPGDYTVAVFAEGYGQSEQAVDTRKEQSPQLNFKLTKP